MEQRFRAADLRVVRNDPYKGGYITEHYGGLSDVAALQVEMRWGLYLDEQRPEQALKHPRFASFKDVLKGAFTALAEDIRQRRPVTK
jgi:N-formylglutamate amidohydrolase